MAQRGCARALAALAGARARWSLRASSTSAATDGLGRWPASFHVPVQWGDMDAYGHVNNLVYLRWCESARIAYFERAGVLQVDRPNVGPILGAQSIRYRIPLAYPDRAVVHATVLRLGTTSFTMGLRVFSDKHGPGAIAAESEATIVMIDYKTGKKVHVPGSIVEAIHKLEASVSVV